MNGARLCAAVLWFAAALGPAAAQRFAQISGTILDPSQAGVPAAAIAVVEEETGFRQAVQSHMDGTYAVAPLRPGTYKITVRKEGFRTVIRFGVRLEAARPLRLDFLLPVGSMQETITVEGTAPAINREDASIGAVVVRDEFERLPLNGRGVLTLLELAPGTVVTPATRGEAGQFTANGQRPNTHYFTVDGVSANTGVSGGGVPAQSTGGALPGMSAFGSLHALISVEALQEFRVQTSTSVPEFGRLPGASISLSSRSGTNEFHGSAFYASRHENLDANDWFANRHGDSRAPLRLHDFGFSLGGPLRRNRTFFFLNYEGMRLRQPFAWRAPVPSLEARELAAEYARPVLNLFPVPNGPSLGPDVGEWSGRNNRPSRLDAGGLRLDHALTSRITLFGRYHDSPSANEFGSTQVNRLELRSRSATVGANVRLGTGLVLDTRLNGSSARVSSLWRQTGEPGPGACSLEPALDFFLRAPGGCTYLARFSIAGVGELISGYEGRRSQTQFQVVEAATLYRGAHSFRFGADYRRLSPKRRDAGGILSVIADTVDDLSAARNIWLGSSGPRNGDTVIDELSLAAQDTWRIGRRLTATYGLRWEFSPAPVPREPAWFLDPSRDIVMPEQHPLWPRTYGNFAPRLGLAFALDKAGKTVIRAGTGLYYDSSVSIATDLINGGPLSVWQYGSPRQAPFSMLLSFGFMPDLRLPAVKQWSASVEHAFGEGQSVSAAYAGSAGRRLIRREIGGPGSSEVTWVALATNHGASDYNGLQLHYRRRLARGFQALASYTWAHSLDDSSSDALVHWAGPGSTTARDRGSSDFDVRQSLTAAFTWDAPGGNARQPWKGWALDGIVRARSGFPITVLAAEQYKGISFANAFRPDLVAGVPVWVVDASAPGGKRMNPAAFRPLPGNAQGSLGRNAITGFGMSQVDVAVRREFRLCERSSLQFRLEAFNALNHANFADPARILVSPLFGQSASMLNLMLGTGSPGSGLAPMFQIGGARSIEATLRLKF